MSRLHAVAKPVQFHKAADQHRVHSARIARISRSAIKAARREARLGTPTVNAALVSLAVAAEEENHLARSLAQRDELTSNHSAHEKGRENFTAFFVDCGQLDSVQSPTCLNLCKQPLPWRRFAREFFCAKKAFQSSTSLSRAELLARRIVRERNDELRPDKMRMPPCRDEMIFTRF